MANIKYETGDVLDWADEVDVIGHQVNCFGIMGGGLALQIANRWPKVLREYQDFVKKCVDVAKDSVFADKARNALLGLCLLVKADECWIANLFGQYDIGGGLRTDYEALLRSLKKLRYRMNDNSLTKLALPVNLGCGLAGGKWETVKALIEEAFEDSPVEITLVEYKNG